MRRSIKIAAVLTLLAVVVVPGMPGLMLVPLTLAIGWIKSAGRFLSVVQPSTGTVTGLILLAGVLLVGTHAFCAWVGRARPASSPWHWRWTCSAYAALVLVLFACAALVGIAHQTAWMVSSPEPIFKRRGVAWKERFRLRNVGNEILERARSNDWNFARVKAELTASATASTWEEFAFYFVGDSNGVPDCVIFLPRNPKHRTEIGIVERANFNTRPFRDLNELLRRTPP